jgi:hypothetical protein
MYNNDNDGMLAQHKMLQFHALPKSLDALVDPKLPL